MSDDDVFAAVHRAMMRLGPGELTLAEIGTEAGVTASALVQRYGSRRQLLLALAARAAESAGEFVSELQARHRSPLVALRAYADCMSRLAASPAALVRNLAYLQIDLADPDFRKHLLVQARATRTALEALIEAALAAGELVAGTDAPTLARTVETVLSGSILTWAIHRESTAARWMREDLEAALAPYLAGRRGRRRGVQAGRRTV